MNATATATEPRWYNAKVVKPFLMSVRDTRKVGKAGEKMFCQKIVGGQRDGMVFVFSGEARSCGGYTISVEEARSCFKLGQPVDKNEQVRIDRELYEAAYQG